MFKVYLLIILIFALSGTLALAQSEIEEADVTEESIDAQFEDYANQLNKAIVMHESGYIVGGVEINDRCESLIDKSGGLGSLGKFARQELMSKMSDYSELMAADALSSHCTNYGRLSKSDRAGPCR